MGNLKVIIIVLLILPKTVYSQYLSISKTERDSIVYKIVRGNEAIEKVKVLNFQIVKRDSVITMQRQNFRLCELSLIDHKTIISNLNTVIRNKDIIIGKEKKISRKRGFWGVVKGVGVGIVAGYLLSR